MAEVSEPDKLPRWADDGAALVTEPSEGKKDVGWIGEMPPADYWNWLKLKTYQWLNYLNLRLMATPGLQADTELTIASGSVTPTRGNHSVDTEGDAASDDLANIVTTNLDDGRLLIIRAANAARTVIIKHAAGGAGQIHTWDGEDFELSDTDIVMVLKRAGADWYEVSRSNAGLGLAKQAAVDERMALQALRNISGITVAGTQNYLNVGYSPEQVKFVAVGLSNVGSTTNGGMYSSNGAEWTAMTLADTTQWRDVCWSPSLALWVAVGTAKVNTSPDGITWTSRTPANGNNWSKVIWVEALGLFIASAASGGTTDKIMTSPDGVTWTARVSPNQTLADIAWSPELGLAVIVMQSGTDRVLTSPDGITWTTRAFGGSRTWTGLTWSPELGLFVAVSGDGTDRIMYSADGLSWTSVTEPESNAWSEVLWVPEMSRFVACSTDGNHRLMSSVDGVTWSLFNVGTSMELHALAWSPELYLLSIIGGNAGMRTL